MSEENLERYKRQGISLYYLVKTDHSTYGDRAETFKRDGFIINVRIRPQSIQRLC